MYKVGNVQNVLLSDLTMLWSILIVIDNRKHALPGLLHDLSSFVVAGYGLRVAKSILCETGNNIFLSFSHHTD